MAQASTTSEQLNVAPEGSGSPSAEVDTPRGKSIFLFADGTGNSSAKLFKTNVWRMYEAVDLGLASPGKHVQIAYYDNGVGTSSFRPLRLLGGIFGIGLKLNVLRLYAFLCRNYQPNDRIYTFGFSRGAFTIRLLVGLIVSQGIIKADDEAALSYQVRDAYRAFCADHLPNRWIARQFAKLFRYIRNKLVAAKRHVSGQLIYSRTVRHTTKVDFVGVWDTVAAYGGPFAEFTRGIDDWVWPLSMPHYGLSPEVLKARHALALDEERDAFHPLLWDEFREQELIDDNKVAPDRLKQVWFTGVHSDVGGGYPDESLSYISLLWMMDELSPDPQAPEVDFVDSFVQRAKDLANPYGPIHDSRGGAGAYYRYQPRKIAAMLDPPHYRTKSLRDPEVSRGYKQEHGLLRKVQVHETAIARIISGIDDYAPAALPAGFEIVTAPAPLPAGSTLAVAAGPFSKPVLRAQDHADLGLAKPHDALRADLQENAWNLVWRRRVTYFATVGVTLILLTLPFHHYLDDIEALCSDDRCFAKDLVKGPIFFLPQSVREAVGSWADKPLLLILCVILIMMLVGLGKRLERRFRGAVRTIWKDYLALQLKPASASFGRDVRESFTYQDTLYLVKWQILPWVFGLATLAALVLAFVALTSQILYAMFEPHQRFCTNREFGQGQPAAVAWFDTANPCADLGVNVRQDRLYVIDVHVADEWKDKTLPVDPARGVTNPPRSMKPFAALKRVTNANWFAPLTEVRTHNVSPWWRKFVKPILGPQIDIRKLTLVGTPAPNHYQGLLCPRRDGHLYMMVNDAAPLLTSPYYNNNLGSAWVRVTPVAGAARACVRRHLSEQATRDLLRSIAAPD